MATYDSALDSAKLRAQCTNATYFIYHQPETWEDCDTGWHIIEQNEYDDRAVDIDEQVIHCSATWGDETGYFSIKEFGCRCHSI